MAYNESAYPNLLFGVSQQAPQDRLPGQLDLQVNMTSDLVGGLRRRPSVGIVGDISPYTTLANVRQYNTDMGGVSVSVIIDTGSGSIRVANEATGALLAQFYSEYLVGSPASRIRLVTLNDAVYICNLDKKLTVTEAPEKASYPDPERVGYFYVVTGAFGKEYRVTLTNRANGGQQDIAYVTPQGTATGDAEKSTPEYIAARLSEQATLVWGPTFGATNVPTGAYVSVGTTNPAVFPTISSTSGSNYLRTSNAASIRDPAELPARLAQADGLIMATGQGNVKTFYRYNDISKVWVEDCNWRDMVQIGNTPVRLRLVEGVYQIDQPQYERRAAGDEKSNPLLKFVTDGITGMAAFQGRLVFLSNEYACMSASDNPLRWFRSTLATVADNDPIEVAAQGSLTAPYEYAVNFNKDLVMFSKRYQGIVPGGTLVTPRTANVSLMTRYEVDTAAEPTAAGRSIFFGAPRSQGYVGMHEMVPSQYADSQYVADDVTAHIPRYVKGPFRFMVSSSTSNIMVAGTADNRELLVHEYLWSAAEKVHASWHKWTFAHPVIDAYFSGDVLIVLFGVNGRLIMTRIDLQRGAGDISPTVPRLDFFYEAACTVAGRITVPSAVVDASPDLLYAFKVKGDGAYLGQKVVTVTPGVTGFYNITIPEAVVGDEYIVGRRYTSSIIPTSPVIKDAKGVPITTTRAVLHRYRVSVANTGQFDYTVGDRARQVAETETTPLRLYSQQLGAGMPLADTETVIIPARVDMRTATLNLMTDDYYDLNIRSIEYGFRYHQRFRRA